MLISFNSVSVSIKVIGMRIKILFFLNKVFFVGLEM